MVTIPVNQLNTAVSKVINGTITTTDLDSFKVIQLEIKSSILKMAAHSPDIYVSTYIGVKCEEDLPSLFVVAKHLSEITSSFSDGAYKLSLDGDKLKISCGRSRFTLPVIKNVDNPEPNAFRLERSRYTSVENPPAFIKNIRRISSSVAESKHHNYSDVISITNDCYVKTNGFVLALARNKEIKSLPRSFNLKESTVQKMLKVLQSCTDITYCLLPDTVTFWCEDTFLSVQQVKDPYPRWEMLPEKGYRDCKDAFTVNSREFKEELGRMTVMGSNIKEGDVLVMDLSETDMKLSVNSSLGDADSTIKVGSASGSYKLKFSLPQIVKGSNGFTDGKIHVKILSETDPVLFYEEDYCVYASQRHI